MIRARRVRSIVLLPALLASFHFFPARTAAAANEHPSTALLMPTADPISGATASLHLLAYPPALVGEASVPIAGRFSGEGMLGYSWLPNSIGGIASASLRAQIRRGGADRWSLASRLQWIGGALITGGEGGGGMVSAAEILASSPPADTRVHGGLALHTMPGSSASGNYGFDNPQASAFAAIERRIGATRVIVEPIWAAIGADGGWDSTFLILGGVKFPVRRVQISIGTGVGWWTFGSGGAALFPVPPLFSVGFDL